MQTVTLYYYWVKIFLRLVVQIKHGNMKHWVNNYILKKVDEIINVKVGRWVKRKRKEKKKRKKLKFVSSQRIYIIPYTYNIFIIILQYIYVLNY